MKHKYVRVGVMTNYNHTGKELRALDEWRTKFPENRFFVNTNSHCPLSAPCPTIVTVNPDLNTFVPPRGDLSYLRAVRIKTVSGANVLVRSAIHYAITWALKNNIKILFTPMRFKSKRTLNAYVLYTNKYQWIKNYFRPVVDDYLSLVDDIKIFKCDAKGLGCPSCLNCVKLTFPDDNPSPSTVDKLYILDLSASGPCKFNCPDCFVKNLKYVKNISFDKLKTNSKLSMKNP